MFERDPQRIAQEGYHHMPGRAGGRDFFFGTVTFGLSDWLLLCVVLAAVARILRPTNIFEESEIVANPGC
jgi:hypothetical protein